MHSAHEHKTHISHLALTSGFYVSFSKNALLCYATSINGWIAL